MRPQPTALTVLSPALLAAALLPLPGLAAPLTNGDFATGTFAGWTTDTDGGGTPTPLSPDFQILGSPGSYAARLEADYYATPGNTGSTALDQVQYANTLLQGLDLTGTPGQPFALSFDWTFGGQETGAPDENVQIGLWDGTNFHGADGSLGFLLTQTAYGSGSLSVALDPSFSNQPGWSIALQLNSGNNANGSYLQIANVEAVPEPGLIFPLGLAVLAGVRRLRRPRPRT
ncbi:hypothetical protein [Candidatus Thiodictyon syntrophicum]|jgi:hypothetical protein|uniref:PEP-CTERM protein-sorting domain-containing protein n=1 Tax=Candidatus Thiodictyon syntrophicum TaxID=1166950 RepID=A0A2K8UEJ4_9GAMM|nr:hypothetical protein [Candidatus Thiodictyon syntrophicum]AUB83927.1 hypothetical protein THSYN_25340 [Candidatus Thiodictyon syntrophicum]